MYVLLPSSQHCAVSIFTVIDTARFACQLLISPYRLLALLAAFFSRSARTSDTGKVYLIRIYMAFLVTFAILVRSFSLHACLFLTNVDLLNFFLLSDGSCLWSPRPSSETQLIFLSTTVASLMHLFPSRHVRLCSSSRRCMLFTPSSYLSSSA